MRRISRSSSGANIDAGPQGRTAWDSDRRLFLVLPDVVLHGCVEPEHRGDVSPHDQGPWPARQFGHLDGAGRAHRRRLGGRSSSRSADVRRDPCRLRTGFDRVGLHHQLRAAFRRASSRRHCRRLLRRRCPACGAMVRRPRDRHRRGTLRWHRQCWRRRRRIVAATHLRHRLSERISVAGHDRSRRRRLVSVARSAKTMERRDAVRCGGDLRGMVFVWTRYIAIALMLAYAMSFGLEIALNAWLPGYFARGFHDEILALGFTDVAGIQIAAGTFAAVVSFNASLFRPFAGFMSDLFQRKGWTPLPFIAKELPYAPRLHWLGIALILIMLSMIGLTVAGLYGFLPLSIAVLVALGIFVSFGTGGTFALVPLLFPDRPGIAAGFIGGISTVGGIAYPLIFASVNHVGYLYV